MKRKLILPQLVRKPNRLRALYIISKRKLGKMTDEKIIVILSAAVFLMQLFIILTAVAAPMHASAQDSVKHESAKPNGMRIGETRLNEKGGQARLNGLQIGQAVPDITIYNIINYKTPTAKFSDFKGKLLILDFWATWCGACIYSIPKTQELGEKFAGKVQFLPVTYQSRKEVDAYLTRLQKLKPNIVIKNHPQVVEDRTLNKLFPHTGLPHYVWIDGSGIIQAMTSFKDVTEANISKMLARQTMNVKVKKDNPYFPYDIQKPLLSNIPDSLLSAVKSHAVFTGYIPGLKRIREYVRSSDTHGPKILLKNLPLTWHYNEAYGLGKKWFSNSRIILEVKDSSKLKYSESYAVDYDTWIKANGHCYELQLPKTLEAQTYPRMQQDLKMFFPQFEAFTEMRFKKVLALVRISDKDKLASKGGKREYKFSGVGASLKNTNLNMLTSQLSLIYLQNSPYPIVNETNYPEPVDMVIDADLSNIEGLNKELAKYDLKFIEKEKEVEVLVIRDRG